jgi:hypothetical protein
MSHHTAMAVSDLLIILLNKQSTLRAMIPICLFGILLGMYVKHGYSYEEHQKNAIDEG